MGNLTGDAKFALRMAAKTPWMTAACILALGAAMAVTIGGFSLLWSAYFARLPFDGADRIVAVRDILQPDPDDAPPRLAVYDQWTRHQSSFEVLAAYYSRSWDVADGEGGLARYPVATITASAFDVARVPPLQGRVLHRADQEPGAPPVVVISHRAWRSLFAGDPGAIGAMVEIDGRERQIVGIMPEGFRFPVSEDFWVPFDPDPDAHAVEPRWMRVFGRLQPDVGIAQAAAELDALRAGLRRRESRRSGCPRALHHRDPLRAGRFRAGYGGAVRRSVRLPRAGAGGGLRERGQPPAGASDRAHRRDRGPRRPRAPAAGDWSCSFFSRP